MHRPIRQGLMILHYPLVSLLPAYTYSARTLLFLMRMLPGAVSFCVGSDLKIKSSQLSFSKLMTIP